jgi:protein-tyrosine phosphatase
MWVLMETDESVMKHSRDDGSKRVRVLFVCMGNICRSPTAEGVFRHLVDEAQLGSLIDVDSAGTHAYHAGEPPDPRSQEEARRRGIDITGQRARQVGVRDFAAFDYVVAMDEQNYRGLSVLCPPAKEGRLYRLCEFAEGCAVDSVPDPYYGGPDGFRNVYDLIELGARGLLARIREKDLKHVGIGAEGG